MSNINHYLDAALKVQNLRSDRQLAFRIDETPANISRWRSGETLPRFDHGMRRLAELAGMDVEQAMIDLGQWRAERADDAATASVYATMRKHLQQARRMSTGAAVGCAALASVVLPSSSDASANELGTSGHNLPSNFLYYGK